MFGLITMMMFFVGLGIYFAPTIVAVATKHTDVGAIFLVNFFFGWSGIGWVAAMLWAIL